MEPQGNHPGTQASPRLGSSLRVHAATIEVTAGPDTGRRARVESPTFVIGTGEQADLRLTDETVSREHVRISLCPSGVRVCDDGSKNGTWIGGVRVDQATVTMDTVLELGKTRFSLQLDAAEIELPLSESESFGRVIGVSPAMRHLFGTLERLSKSDVSVLIEGESGVGKEVLANAIHAHSARAGRPFVAVDCGAIPATLIESELFGHERGSYTGAVEARRGLFEEANGGTLFLDEIGELPIELQPKLLRALETRDIRPLGATRSRAVDVRVISATNRRLAAAAQSGEFRLDLYYRLAVTRVVVPPLRDRREDIAPLAGAFFRAATNDPSAGLPADFLAMLSGYTWPGNVRELRNVIERHAVLGARSAKELFDVDDPRAPGHGIDLTECTYDEARRRVLEQFEQAYVPRVLERAGGVISRAAELAGVARPSFYRMLDRVRGNRRDEEP
jgi:transcriptional regulator with PAS, ATPase and Fis domain